ncbi:MAG: hypothetical protein HZC12_00285 [Nitrospirae bacterium]|nr:hypothetical protein [Nitrospirota bacterium]
MKHEARESISRVEFLGRILRELEHWYSVLLKVGRRPLLDEWRTLTSTLGKRVKVSMAKRIISGIAENIDDDGELIVKLPSGRIEKVCAGDVTILKNSKSKEQ